MTVLGFDTSNYTTSAAAFGDFGVRNVSRLLDVKQGELGLRQSDALFQHVSRLPQIVASLSEQGKLGEITAVAASTRPRAVEGSYMPCFLAGASLAQSMASALGVPFHAFSHQQGHIAAALWSANRLDLMDKPHLAWHLSGGTTELLAVEPEGSAVRATRIGGTTDISAGQVIDRAGKLLGLAFPAGKALDTLAQQSGKSDGFRVKLNDLSFSLSGVENQVVDFLLRGGTPEDTAAFALFAVIDVIIRATEAAKKRYPDREVVFSGGVASNALLRARCAAFAPVFAEPKYSTDNAAGIAVLCAREEGLCGTADL